MGSFLSKSSANTANTGNNQGGQETPFQQFTNSLRRSFRIKRRPTSTSVDRSSAPNETTPTELPQTQTRVRSGLPESWRSGSETASVPPATSPTQSKVTTPKTPDAPTPIETKAEQPKLTVPESKPQTENEVNKAMDMLKGAIAAGVSEDEDSDETDSNVGGRTEDIQYVESILNRIAPEDKEKNKTPESPTTVPKPAVSLLEALEHRRAEKLAHDNEEHNNKSDSESEDKEKKASLTKGVTNVLETIAVESTANKSKEAASLLASMAPPSVSAEEGADNEVNS